MENGLSLSQRAIRQGLKLYTSTKFKRFIAQTKRPKEAFSNLWSETHALVARSPYWKNRLHPQLEANPLTDYETYRACFDEAFLSARSPLNGEEILHWALSSGSSGEPKKFPVTRTSRRQAIEIHLITMASYFERFPTFLTQPAFYLATYGPLGHSPAGTEISFISYYNYLHLPKSVRSFYGTPVEILRDEETMATWRPLYALAQDSSAMVAVTPSVVVTVLNQIRERSRELYDILLGQGEFPSDLPRPNVSVARLRALERAGIAEGNVDFSKVWPSLAFVGCWTDSVCRLQAQELRRLLGPRIPVVETPFSATEAWVTVPLSSHRAGGPIHPGTVLVEFMPLGETDPARLRKPWELETGQDYEMYVTNQMGLVRYRMFDILRCTGHFNEVAEVSFVRKSSQEVSMGLVCVSETELLNAVEQVPELDGFRTMVTPSRNGRGLTLYVRSQTPLSREIGGKVDRRLCELNSQYGDELKRGGSMDPMEIEFVEPESPIWALKHSQSKPYLLRHAPPQHL